MGKARDRATEQLFHAVYGSPFLHAMLGLDANTVENERRPKRQAGREEARVNRRAELEGRFDQGEAVEAALRAIIYVLRSEGSADERSFAVLKELHDAQPPGRPRSLAQLKEALREQSLLFRIDEARAVAAIPKLVRRSEDERARTLRAVRRLVSAQGKLSEEAARRLAEVEALFGVEVKTAKKKEGVDVRG